MKEKRKSRLDKQQSAAAQSSNTFIGFGAFQHSTPAAATSSSSLSHQATSSSSDTLSFQPVYTGHDDRLAVLFPRLVRRDATTKLKALQQLAELLDAANNNNNNTPNNNSTPKRVWAVGLAHYAHVYHHKLAYDEHAGVRAAALDVWAVAGRVVPKAVGQLVQQMEGKLRGQWFAAGQDVTEVRRLYNEQKMEEKYIIGKENNSNGIVAWIHQMLSYNRPSVMHGALFAQEALQTDQQKEANEERFERIIGNALDALGAWVTKQSQTNNNQKILLDDDNDDDSSSAEATLKNTIRLAWKFLTSPLTSLRRRTYQLVSIVATVVTATADDGGDDDTRKLEQPLKLSLSSERESSNLPILLEALLVYQQKRQRSLDLVKPLAKLWSNACGGAPTPAWGPLLWPLVVVSQKQTSSNPQGVVTLLQAAWKGRTKCLGPVDAIALGVTETIAYYLRLHKNATDAEAGVDPVPLVALWNEVWTETLESRGSSSTDTRRKPPARQALLEQLAQNLLQFSQPDSTSSPVVVDYNVVETTADLPTLISVMEILKQKADTEGLSSRIPGLVQALKVRYEKILSEFNTSSGAMPNKPAYEFWQATLAYAGLSVVSDVGRFVTNDILRWLVIHTSRRSSAAREQQRSATSNEWIRRDARLLGFVLGEIKAEEQQLSLWETVLREVVRAECGLEKLATLLATLDPNLVKCATLDDFCTNLLVEQQQKQQQDETTSFISDDESPEMESGTTDEYSVDDDGESPGAVDEDEWFRFFESCLGIRHTCERLVSDRVVMAWVDSTDTKEEIPSYIVRSLIWALLNYGKIASSDMAEVDIHRLIVAAWKDHEGVFQDDAVTLLLEKDARASSFIDEASRSLLSQLSTITSLALGSRLLDQEIRQWAQRAARLFHVVQKSELTSRAFSFSLLGLDNSTAWRQHPGTLLQCVVSLYRALPMKQPHRISMFDSSTIETNRLFADIVVSLSEASSDALLAAKAAGREDMAYQFLVQTVPETDSRSLLESCANLLICDIETGFVDGENETKLLKQVSVLSHFLSFVFRPLIPPGRGSLCADKVKEGDNLWYITKSDTPNSLEKAVVVKAHFEAQTGYYFTVRLFRDGETIERQTVVERLRLNASGSCDDGVVFDHLDEKEQRNRNDFRDSLLNKLILPFRDTSKLSLPHAELINILLTQVGIGSERGIGSPFFDVFSIVKGRLDSLALTLGSGKQEQLHELLCIAVACGSAVNGPSQLWSVADLSIDTIPLVNAVITLYDGGHQSCLLHDCIVIRWLGLCSSLGVFASNDQDESRGKGVALLLALCSKCFSRETEFDAFSLVATETLRQYLRSLEGSLPDDTSCRDALLQCIIELVGSFSAAWSNSAWKEHSRLPLVISEIEENHNVAKEVRNMITEIDMEALAKSIFSPLKRYLSFRLLLFFSGNTKPYMDSERIKLGPTTALRLKSWTDQLSPEQAAELEEDVEVVSMWLPASVMEELEAWCDKDFMDLGDSEKFSRLLTWLAVLSFIDAAVPCDSRNRSAFVAYLQQCTVLPEVLNLAILHDDNLLQDDSRVIPALEAVVADEPLLTFASVSSLVLLRTIEVLPSLTKRWFEEDCPSVYIAPVQAHVEEDISPKILSRELSRMKSSTVFGSMNVTASHVSREINATYVQDDFTLSVLIRLPRAFPFRSAEVDCSKTLGIPASRLKRWKLQITTMLNNQGGTLQDALLLWKRNVDREFEGVEPCPVCYSVLHVKSHKLPTLQCTTCHNRFHSSCLLQWFEKSGKSQCVLCQQPFQGTRV